MIAEIENDKMTTKTKDRNDPYNVTSDFKKRKRLDSLEDHSTQKLKLQCEIENLDCRLDLKPVLDDVYIRSVETDLMFIGKICNVKETSRLIKELSEIWPLQNKTLKRVRRTTDKDIFEIIIRPLNDEILIENQNWTLDSVFRNTTVDTTGLMDYVFTHHIPKYPAHTRKQYEESKAFWPSQFREDKNIENILNDNFFSSKERQELASYMKQCIRVAQHGDVKVGCIVVDPGCSQIIAIAHDRRHRHPLQHAVMVAIDLVAKSQGGGAWNMEDKHLFSLPCEKKNSKLDGKEVSNKSNLPYLCTSFDLFVTREPCIMCAMALVHSRIRRVFYGCPTSKGALGSQHKLHIQSGLNHRYEVWSGLLREDCLALENLNNCPKNECTSS